VHTHDFGGYEREAGVQYVLLLYVSA